MRLFDQTSLYKGNLHAHTTRSDGRLSPEETLRRYREDGYAFVAVTDHNAVSETREEPGFTALSGVELNTEDMEKDKAFHLVGIGMDKPLGVRSGMDPKELQKGIVEAGGLAVLGHPAWSLLEPQDLMEMDLCFATEIYSGISEAYGGRGDSSAICESAAARGCRKRLLGVDDVHFHDFDYGQSWIMLQSPSLQRADLLQSLRDGRFYATQGPEFAKVEIEDGLVAVECSPVARVAFFSNAFWSAERIVRAADRPLRRAEYRLRPGEKWLRVELMDALGRKATTQYFDFVGRP